MSSLQMGTDSEMYDFPQSLREPTFPPRYPLDDDNSQRVPNDSSIIGFKDLPALFTGLWLGEH